MAEKKEDKDSQEVSSKEFLTSQTSAKLRLRAKENLEKAQRVLAESGQQLLKNKKPNTQKHEQESPEVTPNEQE